MGDSRWRKAMVRAFAIAFDLSLKAKYRIEVRGFENFTRAPSTLVVANHRRDADGPIIASVLYNRQGLSARGILPHFVAREDLFRRGFLRDYLQDWPSSVRQLLTPLKLNELLQTLQAYPMRRIRERTLGEVLEDVLKLFGNRPLDQVLKPHWFKEFERLALPGRQPLDVQGAFSQCYKPLLRMQYGLTKLNRAQFSALKPYERAVIESHLAWFVNLLEQGRIVLLEPEGAVSQDGGFARFRGGLHILLNRPRVSVRVLPVGLTYDFMMTGRPRVFINFGPEVFDLQGLSRRETDARVAEAILAQLTVTTSLLASRFLHRAWSNGGGIITDSELIYYVRKEAARCADIGVYVDPHLLRPADCAVRIADYLAYCKRYGTLIGCGRGCYKVRKNTENPPSKWSDPEGVLNYLSNELNSLNRLWPHFLQSINT